jgi:3-oxoacyl-[acyl-carrier protein] reductase
MPWGSAAIELPVPVRRDDFEDPAVPSAVIDAVIDEHGRLDVIVAAHARSSHSSLAEVDADELDRCWRVNVRSLVLMAQRLAEVHDPAPDDVPPTGRLIWFTSGQHMGPMDSEIAYAVSKGALHQMTASIDHALAASRIIANCINPGPVDTGYADGTTRDAVRALFPDRRWGTPDDVANLVQFLVSDAGAWIRGQVLNSEGGFDRFARPRN